MSEVSENPNFREILAPYTEWASETLHGKFPNVEADHLSGLGAGLVALGTVAAISSIKHPDRSKIAFGLNLAGAITDTFDGALAKVCYADNPERLVRGNKVDSASDFVKDALMGTAKVTVTSRNGSRSRRLLAEAATITTPLTSFSRAYMEKRGYKIDEHGGSHFEFLGTRAGRTALHTVSSSNLRFRGTPLQPSLDALITVANLTRIAKNLKAANKEQKSSYAQRKAHFRTRFHGATAALTGTGILAARSLTR